MSWMETMKAAEVCMTLTNRRKTRELTKQEAADLAHAQATVQAGMREAAAASPAFEPAKLRRMA